MPWKWRHTPSSTTVLGGPSTLVWVEENPPTVGFFPIKDEERVLEWECINCHKPWTTDMSPCVCGSNTYFVKDGDRVLGEVQLPKPRRHYYVHPSYNL